MGEDLILGGFVWLAGQGGNGIVISDALRLDLSSEGHTERFDAALLRPA